MAEFDRSIAVSYDYARAHPDTLLLITADHETGGVALISGATEAHFLALGKQREAIPAVRKRLGATPTIEAIQKAFSEATQLPITRDDAETLFNGWKTEQAKVCGSVLQKYYRVGFNSTGHTASPVVLIGFGPGSEACSGWRENTDVFTIMLRATGMMR